MTDRYNALTVVLAVNMRDDDAAPIIAAIQQIKGVLSVEFNVHSMIDHVAERRVRAELHEKLWAVLYPKTTVTVA